MTARVRVVVLNYNGGEMTLECLSALAKTNWPAESLDLVLVDNASCDDVVNRVRNTFPTVTIIESDINRGFAGGCNLGLRNLAEVDYIALINNDVLVEPEWLTPLVAELESKPEFGAACPKILFNNQYLDLTITSSTTRRGNGDNRDLGVQLSGIRISDEGEGKDLVGQAQFVRGFWGQEHGLDGEAEFQWTSGQSLVRLPIERGARAPTSCSLRLKANDKVSVTLQAGGEASLHTVGSEPQWYEVEVKGKPFDVINNVGSVLTPDMYGADRGYLEPAEKHYEEQEEIFSWCGAAVLLSSTYLQQVGLFDERFFLYYEDLELSWRGRKRGWKYSYVPKSWVYHHHSATSVEGSALSLYYNERNRLLTLMLHAPLRSVSAVLMRYLLITASYARRDVFSPLMRGERLNFESVKRRVRSLLGALRLAPSMALQRRSDSRTLRR